MMDELYAAQAKNWLMDLATGAKAAQKSIQFAPSTDDKYMFDVTASAYNNFEQGVAIHRLKDLAKALQIQTKFKEFNDRDHYSSEYIGRIYFEMFGVIFYDLVHRGEEIN